MRAFVDIRPDPHYRRDALIAGLKAQGHEVRTGPPQTFDAETVYVSWNRYGMGHGFATRVERAGGIVIVCENGYIGRDENDRQYYAMAMGGHNGSGQWPTGGPERWQALGVDLKPWRASGDKIVIRGQRGIGAPGMASPLDWHNAVARQLKAVTKRSIQIVQHPGNGAESNLAHEQYLVGAHALVIWSSSVGVKALAMGIPVFYCAPHWICEGAAVSGISEIESPKMDDTARIEAMRRMTHAQWKLSEITTGEPFRALLQ